MREYELVLIFDPEEKAGEVKKILVEVKEWIKKQKGRVAKEQSWGKKILAYPLKTKAGKGKKLQEGEYFQIDFEAEFKAVARIAKKLKLEEKIIRYLFVTKLKKGGEEVGKKS